MMADTMAVWKVCKMAETMGVRKVHMMVANWVLYLAVLSAALLVGLKALRLAELKVASTVVWRAV
jgi:hypothetical protein